MRGEERGEGSPIQQYRYPNRLYLKCLTEEGHQLRHDVYLIGESFLRVHVYACI